jgi:hypothetical protein
MPFSLRKGNYLLLSCIPGIHEPVSKFEPELGESFDKLRTNGFIPFVVSLSNHETPTPDYLV